ncbi:hypothetical protein [Acinetobacter nosocomialis]|uniref:hypothetical protein n=1 Tax=Acinetobacter nosocomialis TaxID=106654 RepID=UPI001ADB1B80|nr:hypothetical protein [Acinetobacter nosocomialis]MBO8208667.1 hypothetical protein [Acinetobacter nosocomialis]MBO8225118.1 hypothetical protein [Acinetobacter nosocomialis]MBO8249573.1 hypothetical protein [Acinetobacter nosocomialis]MDO7229567.1 hypothetical protein [Acinetobacter nosocomialis]
MDDLDYSAPSYVHKDSDRVSVFIGSVIGWVGLFFVLKKIYQTDFSDLIVNFNFETIVLLMVLVGWFFMLLSGLSSVFPIYIDNHGGHYRTLFLRRKNLEWNEVKEIIIVKQKNNWKLQYHMMVSHIKPGSLVWGVATYKGDNYEELYQVVNYYVQKYKIKVILQDRLNNSIRILEGMPKKLDFS